MQYYTLSPEVAGGFGSNTELDSTSHPPIVERLHYAFDGWLGDCLVESFPCFVVTESALSDLKNEEITGVVDGHVEVSTSDEFRELYPNRDIGRWRWLRVAGIPGEDDVAITESACMIASERAIKIFRRHGLKHCDFEEYQKQAEGADGDAEEAV